MIKFKDIKQVDDVKGLEEIFKSKEKSSIEGKSEILVIDKKINVVKNKIDENFRKLNNITTSINMNNSHKISNNDSNIKSKNKTVSTINDGSNINLENPNDNNYTYDVKTKLVNINEAKKLVSLYKNSTKSVFDSSNKVKNISNLNSLCLENCTSNSDEKFRDSYVYDKIKRLIENDEINVNFKETYVEISNHNNLEVCKNLDYNHNDNFRSKSISIKFMDKTDQSDNKKNTNDFSKEDFVYFSDNEENMKESRKAINKKYTSRVDFYTGMINDFLILNRKIIEIKVNRKKFGKKVGNKLLIELGRLKTDDKDLKKERENKANQELSKMVKRYNNERKKKKLVLKKKQQKEENETEIYKFMYKWLERLKVLKDKAKKAETVKKKIVINWDEKELNFTKDYKEKNKKIDEEKKKYKDNVMNIYYHLEKETERYYPDLFSLNISNYLLKFPLLNRRLFYEIFCQYKVLLKICVAVNRTLKIIKEGIDFRTFYVGMPEIWKENEHFAKSLFNIFDQNKNGHVNLDEFVETMIKLKSPKMIDKIDIFLKILDKDGNGSLSFDEVYELSLNSLDRYLNKEDLEIKEKLANAFSKMIFKFCNVDIESEIKMPIIKEKIILGGEAAEYLEMFCGAS